jgi:hypothetical protein
MNNPKAWFDVAFDGVDMVGIAGTANPEGLRIARGTTEVTSCFDDQHAAPKEPFNCDGKVRGPGQEYVVMSCHLVVQWPRVID